MLRVSPKGFRYVNPHARIFTGGRGRARVFFFFPAPRSRVFAPGVAREARRRTARSGPFKVKISGFVKYPFIGECDFVWVAIGPGFASRVKVRRPPAARPGKTERKPPSGDSGRPAAHAPTKGDRGGGAGLGSISGFTQTEPRPPGVDPASHPGPHTPSWRRITAPPAGAEPS